MERHKTIIMEVSFKSFVAECPDIYIGGCKSRIRLLSHLRTHDQSLEDVILMLRDY